MAINRDFIGRTYPASQPYEVGREKIREFARAIGDDSPAYRNSDAARRLGHPDIVAPPTFLIVMSMVIAAQAVDDPDLGVDYTRVVHGEQRFAHVRPVHAGDVLVGTLRITDVRSAGRNEMLTSEVTMTTVEGKDVCVVMSSLVVRGGAE